MPMDHALQCQLVRRVLAHLEHKTTDSAEAPARQPVAAYADPLRYEREVQTLFRKLPLAVGHVSQLAKPGDFITHDHGGVPLLVARGEDGELRAFLNVCRHRGTRVEGAPCGTKRAFTCPYHAWTYALHGQNVHVPHEHGFVGIGDRDLVRVPVAVIAGLVFVVPSPDGEVGDWLGPLAADLEGFGLATSHVYAPTTMTKQLGWKLAIDVFLESYHLQSAHRASIYPMFFDNLGLVDPSGPHLRNIFPKRSIRELAGRPESEWKLRAHANVLFHLFPNTLVLVEPDHAAVLHLWPKGPAQTLLTSYTLVPEAPMTEKARAYWDKNNAILYGAVDEDFAMGESIQRGVHAGAYVDYAFGSYEHALAYFHAQVVRHSCVAP
jgi:phenylpropionate dioxygenase-like ring-hydroxylating dioxygenase large terminal subunit